MVQAKAKLIKIVEVAPKYYKIVLSCPHIAQSAQPGQFIEIKVAETFEPMLRRPFSIHYVRHKGAKAEGHKLEILFEAVGKGSKILSRKKAGEVLDIIGPLGNGFTYRASGQNVTGLPMLVAGGMGVAPLVFLAGQMAGRPPVVLLGARTKNQILCEEEFKRLGCAVEVATDDGSKGFKGRVTDLLGHLLKAQGQRLKVRIYACGPRPMLKAIAKISQQYNIPAQISLEEHMACGIGACLGCVINTKEGYKRVCKEGPVFDADKIIWD